MFNKRFRLILVLAGLMLLGTGLVAKPLLARDPMAGGAVEDYYADVFVPAIQSQDVNLQSTVYEIFLSLLSSINTSILYCGDECVAYLQDHNRNQLNDSGQGPELASSARPTGLIPWLFRTDASLLSTPPVSSVNYLATVGERLHLAQPAYAQAGATGFGYEGLRPAREIWTAFRNIAYLLATIGFVILSFMIMFRVKLSAQTVLGAQQAIFKLVIVFFAISFSYFIAGLIIDLIFLFSFLIISMFVSTGLVGPNQTTVQTGLLRGNIFSTASALLGVLGEGGAVIASLGDSLFRSIFQTAAGGTINSLFNLAANNIGQVIIGLAIIFSLFRLLVALLFAYLEILMLTILAPLMILPDILPGGRAFAGWAKRIFANAMVFPTTVFMLLLGIALVGGTGTGLGIRFGDIVSGTSNDLASGGLKMPFLNFQANDLQALLGVGMILMTPMVVKMVKDSLKVSAFQYTTAIGAAVGFGAGRVMPAIGSVANAPFNAPDIKASAYAKMGSIPGMRGRLESKLRNIERRASNPDGEDIQTWERKLLGKTKGAGR